MRGLSLNRPHKPKKFVVRVMTKVKGLGYSNKFIKMNMKRLRVK